MSRLSEEEIQAIMEGTITIWKKQIFLFIPA